MRVAMLGAGNVGKALASSLVGAGHEVVITASKLENARAAAEAAGAEAADSNRDAVERADVVVLAVPYRTAETVVRELGDSIAGKIVVDVINRVNLEDPASFLDGTSAAEQIQSWAPEARVVKALNYAFAVRMSDPSVDGVATDGFVAANDEEAKRTVLELVGAIGFRPVDAGPLGMSRALEALAMLNMVAQMRNGWSWQTGFRLVGPTS